jgi:hypothetical protein
MGLINITGNELPIMLQQKNSNFKLYTYDGDNCIIDPIAYTPYCNVLRDDKMDEINSTTNTCQYDGFCEKTYMPTSILDGWKQASQERQKAMQNAV